MSGFYRNYRGLGLALTSLLYFSQPILAQTFGALLNPLVQYWVRSQVQQVDNLQVNIQGADRDVLNGQIQNLQLSGNNVIYQGMSARSIQLTGNDIHLDTASAYQGKGLHLLQPVRAKAIVSLSEQDVNAYLASPELQAKLRGLNVPLPSLMGGSETPMALDITKPSVVLQKDRLQLNATLQVQKGEPAPIRITTGVTTANLHQLKLVDPRLVDDKDTKGVPIDLLTNLLIPIGQQLEVRKVSIRPGFLDLEGDFVISP